MSNFKPQAVVEELDQAFTQPLQNEAKQVVDEVGKALEIGISPTQNTQDPQAQAQKQKEDFKRQQDEAKKKKYWQDFLQKFVSDEQKLKNQNMQKTQQEAQKQQEQKQKVEIKQFEKDKKDQSFEQQHITALQAKAERKGGVGG